MLRRFTKGNDHYEVGVVRLALNRYDFGRKRNSPYYSQGGQERAHFLNLDLVNYLAGGKYESGANKVGDHIS